MLLAEAGTDTTTYYIYGPDGLPIEQTDGTTTRYLHHDQLGSTRLITNTTGDTIANINYDPYGQPTTNLAPAQTHLGYTSQYTDPESGLQYLRARYYDPATGQFLTRDPLASSTRDTYGYAARSPLNYADPTGLSVGSWFSDRWEDFRCGLDRIGNWVSDHRDGIVQALAIAAIVVAGVSILPAAIALSEESLALTLAAGLSEAGAEMASLSTVLSTLSLTASAIATVVQCAGGIDGKCIVSFVALIVGGEVFTFGLGSLSRALAAAIVGLAVDVASILPGTSALANKLESA